MLLILPTRRVTRQGIFCGCLDSETSSCEEARRFVAQFQGGDYLVLAEARNVRDRHFAPCKIYEGGARCVPRWPLSVFGRFVPVQPRTLLPMSTVSDTGVDKREHLQSSPFW